MIVTRKHLPRRTFLKGLGVAIAMPMLDSMIPALARGQLRTIGATTFAEYKKHIEKDPALTRRFQSVQVDEPSEPKAISCFVILWIKRNYHFQTLNRIPPLLQVEVRMTQCVMRISVLRV